MTETHGRIKVLDGYRGLAVLVVTLYRFAHLGFPEELVGHTPYKAILVGMAGVDLFFVLSGFLITGILLKSKSQSGYFSGFYRNRILRIFPLYFGSLLLFLVVLPYVFGQNAIASQVTKGELHLWTFTSNLSIAWHNDYHYGALSHFWSLAIEEQFYFVWPFLVLLLSSRRLIQVCAIAALGLAAIRTGCTIAGMGEATVRNFTLFRLDGLLLGSLAAVFYVEYQNWSKQYNLLRFGTLVAAVLYGLCLVAIQDDYNMRFLLVSVVATLLLLQVVASPANSIERAAFESSPLRSLGKYSYAMYVFQYPLIPLLDPIFSPDLLTERFGNPFLAGGIYTVVMFAITYVLAVFSWFAFERHFLALRDHWKAVAMERASVGELRMQASSNSELLSR